MEENILYKHHLAAHSSAEFTMLERKLLNVLLFNAFPNLATQEEFKISVNKILQLLEINTRNYTQLYKAIKNIARTLIEWGVLKTDSFQGELTGVTFLEMYHIKNGLITYRIPRELRALFVEPERYTKIKMTTIAALKSSYGVALYENCSSYIGLGSTGWISLDDFRRLMGVGGKYPEFRDLNKRVIKAALEDINTNSEYVVDLVEYKEARKTSKVKFNVKYKKFIKKEGLAKVLPIKPISSPNESKGLALELENLGVPIKKIKYWTSNFDEKYIRERIAYVSEHKSVKSKPALLTAAIENAYKLSSPLPEIKVDIPALEKQYQAYKMDLILSWVDELVAEDWKYFCELLIQFTDHPIVKKEFEERLYNKTFAEFEATLVDMVDYTEKLLKSWKSKMQLLGPPVIISWKDFMAEQCQNQA